MNIAVLVAYKQIVEMYVFSARVVGICRSWSEFSWFISAEIKRYFCFGDFSPWGRIRRFICIDSLLLPESRVFISDNLEDNLVHELIYIACLCIFLSTNHLHLRLGSGFPVIISEKCCYVEQEYTISWPRINSSWVFAVRFDKLLDVWDFHLNFLYFVLVALFICLFV